LVTFGPEYVNGMHENRFEFDVFGIRKNAITVGLANFLFSIHVYSFMTNNTTSTTGVEGTNNPSGAHEFIPGFNVFMLLND